MVRTSGLVFIIYGSNNLIAWVAGAHSNLFFQPVFFNQYLFMKRYWVCFILRSWLHKILTRTKSCPLDWRTTIHLNVVQTFFQHKHVCQDSARSTFWCIIILQSTGQDPKMSENYGTNISPTFNKNQTLSPGLEKNNALKCYFWIFPTTIICAFMLENCRNNIAM